MIFQKKPNELQQATAREFNSARCYMNAGLFGFTMTIWMLGLVTIVDYCRCSGQLQNDEVIGLST